MNTLLDEYLRREYTNIVFIEGEQTECGDWYRTETSSEVVVAKKKTELSKLQAWKTHLRPERKTPRSDLR